MSDDELIKGTIEKMQDRFAGKVVESLRSEALNADGSGPRNLCFRFTDGSIAYADVDAFTLYDEKGNGMNWMSKERAEVFLQVWEDAK